MDIIFPSGKTWIIAVYLCSLTNQGWQHVRADKCAIYIKDELWPLEWYLNKSDTDRYDMNVLPAWRSCVNGTGVIVGVVDKGIQDHFDLNINRAISFGDAKTGTINSFKHGTRVAGVIGALKNGKLTVGIAFGSEIADIKVASHSVFRTLDVAAFTHRMDIIDVYSSSFANFHTGTVTYPLLKEQEDSFKTGTKFGRGGLGSVYVFATGNSGGEDTNMFRDSCAYDRLVTNRYVISVAGIQNDLTKLPTGESCSAMLVAAFTAKAGAQHHTLVTTDIGNTSTEYFNLNSAATPMVSGAIALALSANPGLSYRDVMHLLVLTCRGDLPEFEKGGNYFMKNAANLSVSSYFGFGLLDIGTLVEKSKVWRNVPQVMNCSASNHRRNQVRSNSHTVFVNMCNVYYAEHVEVSLKVQHRHAGQLQWVLVSPYGTRSTVLPGRGLDPTREMNITVLTVQMWGENPNGHWRLEPSAVFGSNLDNGTVELFSLTIYGCGCIPGLTCLLPANKDSSCFNFNCYNNGICSVDYNGMTSCVCKGDFTGDHCEVSPCEEHLCQNGATCDINSNGNAICNCKATFAGRFCEKSQCTENPCHNGGSCDVNSNGVAICNCKGTFTGRHCEQSQCNENRCQNGGSCDVDSNGVSNCKCKGTFSGKYCEQTPCDNNLCQNGGTCDVDINGVSICSCRGTFSGRNCEHSPCDETHCQNGATCDVDRNSVAVCICKDVFFGEYCENFVRLTTQSAVDVTELKDKSTDNSRGKTTIAVIVTGIIIVICASLAIANVWCSRRNKFCFKKIHRFTV